MRNVGSREEGRPWEGGHALLGQRTRSRDSPAMFYVGDYKLDILLDDIHGNLTGVQPTLPTP